MKKADSSKMEPSAATSEYRDCVVSFIDILGFRNIVSKGHPQDIQKIVQTVQHRAGSKDEEFAKNVGEDLDDEIPWTRTVFFSDSVVRYRPYDSGYRDGSLFYEILDLVHAQADLAYQGIFIRGGLTVGKLYHKDNVLFGPAMVSAYDMESQFANYPRIIVDPAALDALKQDKRLRREGHDLDYEMKTIISMLERGDDGLYYVDYLRSFYEELDNPDHDFPVFLEGVKKAILKEASASHGHLRIYQKYLWMKQYFNRVSSDFENCKHIRISDEEIS